MAENEARRQARRQSRGLLRTEAILRAAELLFAELGYDKTTTNMIAERAGVSPGSLYQFFSNKEAIASAYAVEAVGRLHQIYDSLLAPPMLDLPLTAFTDALIDELIAFNRAYPGYFALSLASTLSEPLAHTLKELQAGVQARLNALFTARWPDSSVEQRQIAGLVSYRIL
jgi:AcrR family transcriptional regulator